MHCVRVADARDHSFQPVHGRQTILGLARAVFWFGEPMFDANSGVSVDQSALALDFGFAHRKTGTEIGSENETPRNEVPVSIQGLIDLF